MPRETNLCRAVMAQFFDLVFFTMSYRDNGEGRPEDMNLRSSSSHATGASSSTTNPIRPAGSSSSILISIPTPMRDVTPATHHANPEITPDIPIRAPPLTPPHLRPILNFYMPEHPGQKKQIDLARHLMM